MKKLTPALELEIEDLEIRLDLFNIMLVRKQIELCKDRLVKEEIKFRHEQSWAGWLKSWIVPTEMVHVNLEPLSPDEYSSDEKRALMVAIGYTEPSNMSIHAPSGYVDTHIDFRLDKLKVVITQDDRKW